MWVYLCVFKDANDQSSYTVVSVTVISQCAVVLQRSILSGLITIQCVVNALYVKLHASIPSTSTPGVIDALSIDDFKSTNIFLWSN